MKDCFESYIFILYVQFFSSVEQRQLQIRWVGRLAFMLMVVATLFTLAPHGRLTIVPYNLLQVSRGAAVVFGYWNWGHSNQRHIFSVGYTTQET